jgi:CRP-like cAMP-binding protein
MSEAAISLPRGGLYVKTSKGAIQFGMPPETIKDSMAAGLQVPTVYVVPHQPFHRRRGLNVAECEFPAYYNFFILKRRIRLVVDDASHEGRIRSVFQESLFGPPEAPQDGEFDPRYPKEIRPDFARETDHFRRGVDGKRLDVDTLVEFVRFDAAGRAAIDEGVWVDLLPDGSYSVFDGGDEVATAPAEPELPDRRMSIPPTMPFEPPELGVTVLGASHGFDPTGKTTGFVIWVAGRGLLVDPPVDATMSLREQGVPSKLIDGIILTHCHADHDSGTFQKILDEGRVAVYTTPTILGSFLRKYSALSGLSEDLLRRTFVYNPVKIGAPLRVHGAEISFFYTLHSIPTIGFELFYGGKSLAFSSDSHYDPAQIKVLQEKGVLKPGRAAALLAFPWHHSLILHEAGVPPLHTPSSVLAQLPDDVKARLYVVHIAEKDVPKGSGLKVARTGVENTLRIEVESSPHADAIAILDAFHAVDLFRDFSISRASEILQVARRVRAAQGEIVIRQGTPGDSFYIMTSGVVSVVQNGAEVKTYQAGDYFGETALILGQPRSADIVAKTDVSLIEIGRYDFLYLLRETGLHSRLVRLAKNREERSWEVVEKNSVLRALTSAQKTQLQSYLSSRIIQVGDLLWMRGDPAAYAFLLDDGVVSIESDSGKLEPFRTGAFLGEFEALRHDTPLCTTARVTGAGKVFQIDRDELMSFFQENPGVLVSFVGTKFVELGGSDRTDRWGRAGSRGRGVASGVWRAGLCPCPPGGGFAPCPPSGALPLHPGQEKRG